MDKNPQSLGELELEVLKDLWDHPGSSVQAVFERLGKERSCARTTILTVMQRLHAKGYLKRRRLHGAHRYKATQGRKTVLGNLIGQFVERVLDGSAAPFLAYLAESEDLSEKQMRQIRRLISAIEEKE